MRLSYLSFACPITGHPLEEAGGGRGGSQMGAAEDEVHVGNVEQYLGRAAQTPKLIEPKVTEPELT